MKGGMSEEVCALFSNHCLLGSGSLKVSMLPLLPQVPLQTSEAWSKGGVRKGYPRVRESFSLLSTLCLFSS